MKHDLEDKLNNKSKRKAFDEFQRMFLSTFYFTSILVPYFFPSIYRLFKEVDRSTGPKINEHKDYGLYAGLVVGAGFALAEVKLYYEYGLERGNLWLLGIPFLTNLR